MRLKQLAQTTGCTARLLLAACLMLGSIPARAGDTNRVQGIEFSEEQHATVITLKGTERAVFTAFKLEKPDRLSLDLANAELSGVKELISADTTAVSQILCNQYRTDGKQTVRVVIGLRVPAKYTVRADGTALKIVILPEQTPANTAKPISAGRSKKQAGAKQHLTKAEPRTAKHHKAAKTNNTRSVEDIRFVDADRESRVEVQVAADVTYRLEQRSGQPTLVLTGAALPTLLERTMDTSAFSGPIKSISSYRAPGVEDTVRIDVSLADPAQSNVERVGDRLIWRFAKGSGLQTASTMAHASESTDSKGYRYQSVKVAPSGDAGRIRNIGGKRFVGRRIDLDFRNADIHNLLRLLSEVGDVNIVTSDAVGGSVTIKMKNVPWDHALDVILRAKGLGMVREGNLLRVAPRSDLEKEREAEIARQKQVLMLQPLETRLIPISYAKASQVLSKLRYMLSPRGKLANDKRTNMVIARDISSNLDLIEEMIKNLDTQTPQVLIEARIIEARTNYAKQIGIQWGAGYTASDATGNATGLVFPYQFGIGGGVTSAGTDTTGILLGQGANPNFLVNMPAPAGVNSGSAIGFTFGSVDSAFNLNVRLSAAESTGDIRVISAPKITTLDNVQANIEQGVQIPFSQISANGVQTTFVDAKLNLSVQPHVTAEGSVVMKIQVTRNEPDFANTGALGNPTILKKQARTEMLIDDGDTAVIGGIYTTRDSRAWQKVPWFAEIPVVGWLFKTRRDASDREEVLVFITPRIINRAQSIGR